MKPLGEDELRDSWNRLSPHYQHEHAIGTDVPHYGTLAPNEDHLRLVGDVGGKRLLEIGCGGGQNAIAFARRGATCLGIDLSDAQIAYAVALAEQEGVANSTEFRQGEMVTTLEALASSDGGFDIAFSAYALQYVEDLPRCFAGVCRLLRPGGIFAFSLDHPLSDITAWNTDAKLCVVRESYFDRTCYTWDWDYPSKGVCAPMRSFHRTVGDIVAAVVGSGMVLDAVIEPEPVDEFTSFLNPGDTERYALIPATLIVRAHRPLSS